MDTRVIVLVAVVCGAGCASAHDRSLASSFVRQGTPTVDLGGPRPASHRATSPRASTTERQPSAVARMSTSMSSLESHDPELQSALMGVLLAPTVQHHLGVARAYKRLGILDNAYDYLAKSLEVNGPDPAVYDALARLWRDWGHPELGLADAHRAVYLSPASAATQNTLGTLLYRLGQTRHAEAQFNEALTLDPNAWYVWANLCHLNLAQGRTREAIAQCKKATALRPKQQAATKSRTKIHP